MQDASLKIIDLTNEWLFLTNKHDVLNAGILSSLKKIKSLDANADLIYFDEERPDASGKIKIWRKPDFSPDLLMSCNYFGDFVLIRRSLFERLGGLTDDPETDALYDLFLKCAETGAHIVHLPEIPCHRQFSPADTDRKDTAAERKAIQKALERRQLHAQVTTGDCPGIYTLHYAVTGSPKVSILIPTRDHAEDLKLCIDSILKKTRYRNWEIIIIDNGTTEAECLALFETYRRQLTEDRFKVLKIDRPFNFSELNNAAAEPAEGDFLLLLNNDIEIITEGWLTILLGYAQQKHIGAVGAKLIYADESIQHAGIVMGIGGMAGHSHKGHLRHECGYFGRLAAVSNVSAVTAAMMMIDKRKYFEVGGLNEKDLKVAFNDVDLCLKLLDKGYFNVVLPQVEAYHYESKSRGTSKTFDQQQREHREADYIRRHWQKYLDNDPFYNPHLTRRTEDFSDMIFPENTCFFDWYRAIKQKLSHHKYLR